MQSPPKRERFWIPPEKEIHLTDGGFLVDPTGVWGKVSNPDCVPLSDLRDVPCLHLLGEPGMGKSTALKAEYEECRLLPNVTAVWFDLHSYASGPEIRSEIFRADRVQEWKSDSQQGRLMLFLDGLDECLLLAKNVSTILLDEFRKLPVARLYLRITCRTADRQGALDCGLPPLWGKPNVKTLELAPLRHSDVLREAEGVGIHDPQGFIDEVYRRECAAFAARPVTLRFLLHGYQASGAFPATRIELYKDGCVALCREQSGFRHDARVPLNLSAHQRFAVAARIAALQLFSTSSAVFVGPDPVDRREDSLALDDVIGDEEPGENGEVDVTLAAVRETLDTGLFSGRGVGLIGFAHQSYLEFLAAHYLCARNVSAANILTLITHPAAPDKVVPQLNEVAAWIACMQPEVFQHLVATSPEVLLLSDAASAQPEFRKALTCSLLAAADCGTFFDFDWSHYGHYRKLAYPSIDEDLRPFVSGRSHSRVSRRVAINIAEAVSCTSLLDDLLVIALDVTDDHELRKEAASAISEFGDPDYKAKLKPLLHSPAGEDPDDELKGCALLALWPGGISAAELFSAITPPKKPMLIGAYSQFLRAGLIERLDSSDLIPALAWAETNDPTDFQYDELNKLFDRVMVALLRQHRDWSTFQRTAHLVKRRLEVHWHLNATSDDEGPQGYLLQDSDARRALLKALLPEYLPDTVHGRLAFAPWLVQPADISFLLTLLPGSHDSLQRTIAALVARLLTGDVDSFDLVFRTAQSNVHLQRALAERLPVVELGSEEASRQREWYKSDYPNRKPVERNQHLVLPIDVQSKVTDRLNEIERGNTDGFFGLTVDLTRDPKTGGSDRVLSLVESSGWISADPRNRSRIVSAAADYLKVFNPWTLKWIRTHSYYNAAYAGYQALRLIEAEKPELLSHFTQPLWEKCAVLPLAIPYNDGDEQDARLLRVAYAAAPDAIVRAIQVICAPGSSRYRLQHMSRLLPLFDDCLHQSLLEIVRFTRDADVFSAVLRLLLRQRSIPATQSALSAISFRKNDEVAHKLATSAAVALIEQAEARDWDEIWAAVVETDDFAVTVVESVTWRSKAAEFLTRLNERQLADLLLWLLPRVRPADDVLADGQLGTRHHLQSLRQNAFNTLKNLATREAIKELRRIAENYPGENWLAFEILQAESQMLRRAWEPVQPKQVLRIVRESDARLVKDANQLLAVIRESLGRMQCSLQGQTGTAIRLWNEPKGSGGKKIYTPKDENSFSDEVLRHLIADIRDRGIVLNREVEIRRPNGGAAGERTDIDVQAVAEDAESGFKILRVIIEVKGAWNEELETAMKTQLVDRYLFENECQMGLYLVGWFHCEQWSNNDAGRRNKPKDKTREQLHELLTTQANELSVGGLTVAACVLDCSLR